MTIFNARPPTPDKFTPGEMLGWMQTDPYWKAMRGCIERAFMLALSGKPLVHIVPAFHGMEADGWEAGNKVLIPFPVAGDPAELVEVVSTDLEQACAYLSEWLTFVPARLVRTPDFAGVFAEHETEQ